MKIILNGEDRLLENSPTLAQLVDQLGMKPDRVAVERNRSIVPKSEWPTTQLAEGDRLEIVHFVGGGASS
jgi:thiamine biosynthesis protein ThiS